MVKEEDIIKLENLNDDNQIDNLYEKNEKVMTKEEEIIIEEFI